MTLVRTIKYLLLLYLFSLTACSESTLEEDKIIVATAANMQFAMEALSKAFTKSTGIKCELVLSSSGKLTAQIKEGAPFDVFVAANMKYPEEVYKSGLATAPAEIYAYGKLVLWSMKANIEPSLAILNDSKVEHIALANPETAPYGQAAIEALRHSKLLESVQKKLVYGESIAQANQFINTQSAEIGFTAKSVVLSPKLKGKGQWVELDTTSYTAISQGVILLNRNEQSRDLATQFFDFLFSEKAQSILNDYGYQVKER